MLVVPRVGVQLGASRGLRLSSHRHLTIWQSKTLYPLQHITDVQIVEGITGWSLRYWLVVMLQETDNQPFKLVVPFQVCSSLLRCC